MSHTAAVSSGASVQARYDAACARIPGMTEILQARGSALDSLLAVYPGAAFARMLGEAMWRPKDTELGEICSRAYTAILRGENVSGVRTRYEKDMESYVSAHMWDD